MLRCNLAQLGMSVEGRAGVQHEYEQLHFRAAEQRAGGRREVRRVVVGLAIRHRAQHLHAVPSDDWRLRAAACAACSKRVGYCHLGLGLGLPYPDLLRPARQNTSTLCSLYHRLI